MAFFMDEANNMLSRIADSVDKTLLTTVSDAVCQSISESVYRNVYPLYTPSEYVRRGENGGLPDASQYDISLDPATHTLTVSDDRHEVAVVQSGMGYSWTESRIFRMQPYPRPYFPQAEAKLVSSGIIDGLVQDGLNSL